MNSTIMKTLTATQIEILERETASGFDDSVLHPIYGSGEHRSAYALEKAGYGIVCSSSHNSYHQANRFFKFNDGFKYNFITKGICNCKANAVGVKSYA